MPRHDESLKSVGYCFIHFVVAREGGKGIFYEIMDMEQFANTETNIINTFPNMALAVITETWISFTRLARMVVGNQSSYEFERNHPITTMNPQRVLQTYACR
jgi:hypothetical protein